MRVIVFGARRLLSTMLRNIIADHRAQESIVEQSDLGWTIVRPGVLKDRPGEGRCTATKSGPIKNITREDVATFLAALLGDDQHMRQAISITN